MSTALLRCLFRNLMFYQVLQPGDVGYRPSQIRGGIGRVIAQMQEAVSRRRDHMKRALMLAVKWNQVAFAKRMLAELPGSEDYSR